MELIFSQAHQKKSTDTQTDSRLKPFAAALLIMAAVVCSAYLGSDGSLILSVASLILATTVMIIFTKAPVPPLLVIISAAIIWLITGSIGLAALLGAAVTVICSGAFLLRMLRSPFLLLTIPASYALAFLFSGSFITALWSLLFFPSAYVLALSFDGKTKRTSAICRTGIAIVATFMLAGVIAAIAINRSLNADFINSTADKLYKLISDFYTSQLNELTEIYKAYGIDMSMIGITERDIKQYALSLFGILPALFAVAVSLLSFFAHLIGMMFFKNSRRSDLLNESTASFSMSWISATLFLAAYLTMFLFTYIEQESVMMIAENIYIILLPGLVLTGTMSMLGNKQKGTRPRIFMLVLAVVLIVIAPSLAVALTAFIGSTSIIGMTIKDRFSRSGPSGSQ